MEDALSSKMAEFMTALDQVKKYKTIATSMPDFALIVLGLVVTFFSVNVFMRLSSLFVGLNHALGIIAFYLIILLFIAGIIVAILRIRRKVKSVEVDQWTSKLDEGAPGALELLQGIQWDNVFSDIRYAKLGFVLYGIAKILAFWGLAVVAMLGFNWLLEFVLHMSIDTNIVLLFSLVTVLILSRNDLRKRYEQMGRLDWLMWELRWFESEFRGANFEA